ncbi:MAG: FAD-dependent oxidoreductase [Clostridia bacterium]|nr:FAD-dependent oxidoreductase [Clostridia bacterium]
MLDLIIIGGGVAGMTAGLYALRNNKSVLILEKDTIGGQITQSPCIENYPTIEKISGSELSDRLFEQIMNLGAQFEVEEALKITKNGNEFEVQTDCQTHHAKAVVIATGVTHRKLRIEGSEKFEGKGVYYCAICDGPLYKGKNVSVIGGGNSALQFAIMLAGYCNKVSLFVRGNAFSGEEVYGNVIATKKNIEVFFNCNSKRFVGDEKLDAVEFEKENGETFLHKTDAVFVAIGQVPDNKRFENVLDLDKYGYIIAGKNCTTKTEGVFVAGDCNVKDVRQVATAIGDGATAGTEACKYLNTLE